MHSVKNQYLIQIYSLYKIRMKMGKCKANKQKIKIILKIRKQDILKKSLFKRKMNKTINKKIRTNQLKTNKLCLMLLKINKIKVG